VETAASMRRYACRRSAARGSFVAFGNRADWVVGGRRQAVKAGSGLHGSSVVVMVGF
jgi:hypothetical protein